MHFVDFDQNVWIFLYFSWFYISPYLASESHKLIVATKAEEPFAEHVSRPASDFLVEAEQCLSTS